MSKSSPSLNEVVRLHIKKVEQIENEKGELTLFSNITNQEYHQKLKIKIDESELIRIIKHLNPDNIKTDGSTFAFVQDLLILKVSGSIKKYSDFANVKVGSDNNIGKLILNITDDNEKDKILEKKTFKRKICASGHNRAQKVMFVSECIYDKLDAILLCGLDPNSTVIPSKFNAYDGLCATDSKPVTMPKIVVVDDFRTTVQGKYDVVTMTTTDKQVKGKTVTKHTYSVESDKKKSVEILPFDGAGLVSVDMAKRWATELGKDYIPASFQFRCLAGLKGNQFTFDVDEFSRIYGTKIKAIHDNVDAFLQYRNIREFEGADSEDEPKSCQEWNFIQPYYQALLYNHSLFNDEYIKGKIKRDIKTIIRKACMGKISVKGNYQTLAPDIYGLAQYAFGQEVTGLIGKDEIYSNYWNNQYDKVTDENGDKWYIGIAEVDLLRSPHVANEHCPVKVVTNKDMGKWFKYQTVNILTGFKDTNVLKASGADFDGDHVLTVNNPIILTAAKRNHGLHFYWST